jgi:hypothetical protein
MTETKLQQQFPMFRISVQKGENGQRAVRILTDDDEADRALEAMGLTSRYSPQFDANVFIATPAQVAEFWQRIFSGQQEFTSKAKLSEKQRQARVENAKRATKARLAKQHG